MVRSWSEVSSQADDSRSCCRFFLGGLLRTLHYSLAISGLLIMTCDLFMFMEWTNAAIDPPLPIPPASRGAEEASTTGLAGGLRTPCASTAIATHSSEDSRIETGFEAGQRCREEAAALSTRKLLHFHRQQQPAPQYAPDHKYAWTLSISQYSSYVFMVAALCYFLHDDEEKSNTKYAHDSAKHLRLIRRDLDIAQAILTFTSGLVCLTVPLACWVSRSDRAQRPDHTHDHLLEGLATQPLPLYPVAIGRGAQHAEYYGLL